MEVIPISVYLNLNNKQTKMKKVIAIFAIATTLVACGGNASTEVATDSTAVAVDSTVATADTAVAPVVDTTIAK
jgi:PBP1b-binding outer membrane lipoprotein LpoB